MSAVQDRYSPPNPINERESGAMAVEPYGVISGPPLRSVPQLRSAKIVHAIRRILISEMPISWCFF